MAERSFRFAGREDTPLILSFIRALAEYERMSDQVVATEELLEQQLFDRRGAEVLFALEDGREVGFALFFHNFSTFLGRSGLYLEDLYVLPEHRGKGFGKALLQQLGRIARQRGCGRMEWWCLDWNRPSIDFYLSLGAEPMTDWTVYRLSGDTLAALGGEPGVRARPAAMRNETAAQSGLTSRRFCPPDRIERVERFERLFDAAKACPDAETLRLLEAYYTSGQWQEDYEADERGELPPELKRGVLSQDALYDLLERNDPPEGP